MPVSQAGLQTSPAGAEDIARRGLVRSLAQWAWDNPGAFVARSGRQFLIFWELSPSGMSSDDSTRRAALHRRDPRLPVQALFPRRLRDIVSAASSALEFSLALLGLVLVARTRQPRALLPLAVILAYAAGYALFVGALRYRMTVLPLVFLFSGAGAAWVLSSIRRVDADVREP
jgi:hypothetical protein